MLVDYFRNESAMLSERCLADIRTKEDWEAKRGEYRRQLAEMLGLWPMPERTDLHAVITGKLEQEDFRVEKLHFQASPHLYVTANLYLPKTVGKPVPAILYACGHSEVKTNGVSCGNKTAYQHHGAWFARNGYVCLVIDSLQLGEIQGIHHGTHHLNQWWWNSRGYTPAGVEAWFGIRALDYLCTRPEVDKEHIGMTGRSGGGSYTWTVSALDDRIKVAAPIAGITDLENQVVDGCVEGHCDCMFYLNTYQWDFPQMGALIAPRPLLIGNSDKDKIFPLDGVNRLHEKVRNIYKLYGEADKLGLLITEGPHSDTQDLQVPVFRWFNRFLKSEQPLIEMAAKKIFDPMELRVFDKLPADAVNTNIQSLFVPKAKPFSTNELRQQRESLLATLKEKTFGGWPAEDTPLDPKEVFSVERDGLKFSAWDFTSQHDVRLRLYFLEGTSQMHSAGPIEIQVMDADDWHAWLGRLRVTFETELTHEIAVNDADDKYEHSPPMKASECYSTNFSLRAFFAPRGRGLTAWSGDDKKQIQIRRRFMLLGQTLDGMRAWDIRRAIQAIHFVREGDSAKVKLVPCVCGDARFAALFEPGSGRFPDQSYFSTKAENLDYMNMLKYIDDKSVFELIKLQSPQTDSPLLK